ncbi:hypothetical protein [Bacillus cereus]|nr:hypothetical protein [Bacillus cereus]
MQKNKKNTMYTCRGKSTKAIKLEAGRSLKEEMKVYQDQKVKNP